MIVNESDKARPRHRNEQLGQDPGHRRSLISQPEVGQAGGCRFRKPGHSSWRLWKSMEPERTAKDLQCDAGVERQAALTLQGKEWGQDDQAEVKEARAGGTKVKLCPLRLNMTEGMLKKEAQFNVQLDSERAGR